MFTISRRSLLSLGLAATSVSLAGCSGSSTGGPLFGGLLDASGSRRSLSGRTISKPNYSVVYASYPGEPAPVKEFNYCPDGLGLLATGGGIPRDGGAWHRGRGSGLASPLLCRSPRTGRPVMALAWVARASAGREPQRSTCGAAGPIGCRRRRWWPAIRRSARNSWRPHAGGAFQEVRRARSGRGRCISSQTAGTRAIASTAPRNLRRSAPTCRPAAFAWSTRM